MPVTFIGVRHHSPACARLVADTIEELRPAYVLIEGPADFNPRIDELLLGHTLPVAVFSSYRDDTRRHASWAPLCDYSPEWVALTTGRRVGAALRFIDLPAWHPAFTGRTNRYADAELRYAEVMSRLCHSFDVDNVDALWDHLFEIAPPEALATRLATYFDLVRGESEPGDSDRARESYMSSWITAAAAAAPDRPIVVVTGGFHRPALVAAYRRALATAAPSPATPASPATTPESLLTTPGPLVATPGPLVAKREPALPPLVVHGSSDPLPSPSPARPDWVWPAVPAMPDGAVGGSFLVPYSFRRLDSFDGYQSGMPSPGYYQELWESGADGAARHLVEAVAGRLRERKQAVSTAHLIAARATADGLALVRGHHRPGRTDVLDGLASALVSEALDVPLPWASRGMLGAGSHPVVVEMVAALSGTRVGRLHPSTPAPPLVHDLDAELARSGLDGTADLDLDLTEEPDRARSRVLHRVRILGVPGFQRESGPTTGLEPKLRERWTLRPGPERLTAVIEAGAYGATLADACAAVLAERAATAGRDVDALATVLFDAALSGTTDISARTLTDIEASVGSAPELGALGRMLAVVLTMWRHDRIFGTAQSTTLGTVIATSVRRVLWLAEGLQGADAPADPSRIAAMAACRDALRHAAGRLGLDRATALETAARVAADQEAPPDLRGAAFGFRWALQDSLTSITSAAPEASAAQPRKTAAPPPATTAPPPATPIPPGAAATPPDAAATPAQPGTTTAPPPATRVPPRTTPSPSEVASTPLESTNAAGNAPNPLEAAPASATAFPAPAGTGADAGDAEVAEPAGASAADVAGGGFGSGATPSVDGLVTGPDDASVAGGAEPRGGGGLDPVRAVRGAFQPRSAGDWLAGLFALAREEVLQHGEMVGLLDELMSGLSGDDFLLALPALRQAFEYFPPREREAIAERVLARRGLGGSGRQLLRGGDDPAVVAAGMVLDDLVDAALRREELIGADHD